MWTIPPYSLHFYGVAAVSGLLNKALCVCVRYKRKGLNQVGHSLVPDQKPHQQHNTQQQHDLHWNEHHEQSKLSVSIFSLLLIRLTDNLHKQIGLKFTVY